MAAWLFGAGQAEGAPGAPVVWNRLSSEDGSLPTPAQNDGQIGLRVVDLDLDGQKDFVMTLLGASESIVWYRADGLAFTKYIVDARTPHLTHGEGFRDIDGDGDLDLLFGEDGDGNAIYWWENPYPNFDPAVPWTRHRVRDEGGDKYHDCIWGDFDGDGTDELMSWNQKGRQLLLFEVPNDPKNVATWPVTPVYTWDSSATSAQRSGIAAIDINLDGKTDFVGGGGWFEHDGGTNFTFHSVDPLMLYGRHVAGQVIPGGRPEIVCIQERKVGPLNMYQWDGSAWQTNTILSDVDRSHTLQLGDINLDGHMDILTAALGEYGPCCSIEGENPNAKCTILYGDGQGNFTPEILFEGQGDHEGRLVDIDNDGDLDFFAKPFGHNIPRIDLWINQVIAGCTRTLSLTEPTHGSIEPSPSQTAYACDQIVTVTAVPDPGYEFGGWSGDLTGMANPAQLTMDADKSIEASFVLDTTPPSINDIAIVAGATTATVSWRTDEPASSRIDYGTTTSYEIGMVGNAELTTDHYQQLEGLTPETEYHLMIRSEDAGGNATSRTGFSLNTTVAPVVPQDGLALWLDAGVGVTQNAGVVSRWEDRAGSGIAAAQGQAGWRPSVLNSGPGGLPVVAFDGVDDSLQFQLPINGLSELSLVLVCAQESVQSSDPNGVGRAPLFWNETSGWGSVHLSPFQSVARWRFGTGQPGNLPEYVRPSSLGNQFSVSIAVKDGTEEQLFIDGELVRTETGKLGSIDLVRDTGNLGRGYDDDTFFHGKIAEVLVYERALSGVERVDLEEYLLGKYFETPIDDVPPESPAGLTATAVSTDQIDLSWTASTDNLEVVGYRVFRNGFELAATSGTSYSDTELPPATGFSYSVIAVDAAGNESASSSPAEATTFGDTTAPLITDFAIAPGSTTARVIWTTDEAANSRVDYGSTESYELGSATSEGTSTEHSIDLVGLSSSTQYYVRVVSTDEAGNEAVLAGQTFSTTVASVVPQDGLALWLDAGMGITQDAGVVSRWEDRAGSGIAAAQGQAGWGPSVSNSGPGGLPVVAFDGVDDSLQFQLPINGLSELSLVLVCAQESVQSSDPNGVGSAPLFWNETAGWGSVHLSPFQSVVRWRFGTGQRDNLPAHVRPVSLGNEFSTTMAIKDGPEERLYVGGELVRSEVGKIPSLDLIEDTGNLGRGYDDDTFFHGKIAEVLVYPRALSESERLEVERYLHAKYFEPATDESAPETPGGLTASAVSSDQIDLSWEESTDNVGVSHYKIFRDGTELLSTPETAHLDGGLSPDTEFTYSVVAVDEAGNESSPSAEAQAATMSIGDAVLLGWRGDYFTGQQQEDEQISGLLVDFDEDFFTNLVEYALGTDPRRPDPRSGPLTITEEGEGVLAISFVRRKNDPELSVWCQVSIDLVTWRDDSDAVRLAAVTPIGDVFEEVVYHVAPEIVSEEGCVFGRAAIQR